MIRGDDNDKRRRVLLWVTWAVLSAAAGWLLRIDDLPVWRGLLGCVTFAVAFGIIEEQLT